MTRRIITIPSVAERALRRHLLKNELEQGAFLFGRPQSGEAELKLVVEDLYLVPEDGWETQLDVYLEMKDSERAKIMALAQRGRYAVVDCHSHPKSVENAEFSASDRSGIQDFAAYAKWKLAGRPFAAMVLGEESLDAVIWADEFRAPLPVDVVQIVGGKGASIKPTGSWFRPVSQW